MPMYSKEFDSSDKYTTLSHELKTRFSFHAFYIFLSINWIWIITHLCLSTEFSSDTINLDFHVTVGLIRLLFWYEYVKKSFGEIPA